MEQKIVQIQGKRTHSSINIWVDGKLLHPYPSQRLRNHSPDGFNWGYSGSGPAQAALGILLHVLDSEALALALYQHFKFQYVAAWPVDGDFKVAVDIEAFLSQHPDTVAGVHNAEQV